MRVLLLGATGFLGRHICAHLLEHGFTLTAAVRDEAAIARRFPGVKTIEIDMNAMVTAACWLPHLEGIDAVVNCAGILQSSRSQSARSIHALAPAALFDACAARGVRRVVQLSAVSADIAAGTEYALTKKSADDHLASLDLDWVVLRPSLVYAQGSFGGTSALRGLAGLPFITPLPGDGSQLFQPIHVQDLAKTIAICLTSPALVQCTLDPVGPETMPLRNIVVQIQSWLDLPATRSLAVPLSLVRLGARMGDLLGRGVLRSTAIDQLIYGNTSDSGAFAEKIGFRPRSFAEALRAAPSHVQDRWHARLYWLRPCLTLALVLLWMGSGVASLVNFHASLQIAQAFGAPAPAAAGLVWIFALLDMAIGCGIILDWPRRLGAIQLIIVAGYSAGFTLMLPGLWLDPAGPLLKNLPILAAIGLWSVLRSET